MAFRIVSRDDEVANCSVCNRVLDELVDADVFRFGFTDNAQFAWAALGERVGEF